jgi:hypothetical protein
LRSKVDQGHQIPGARGESRDSQWRGEIVVVVVAVIAVVVVVVVVVVIAAAAAVAVVLNCLRVCSCRFS